ncbi:MAG: hypothetical protein M1827_006061 [Pycnora praestabilis]|nr:MAG: hypothetical protein M1827_006061 [Pycnora praestabilis]
MSSRILLRLNARSSISLLQPTVGRSLKPSILSTVTQQRYASDPATAGGNPLSSSKDSADVNASRSTDSASSAGSGAASHSPIPGSSTNVKSDEPTTTHEEVKRDPKESDEEKRKHVEAQGNKPLDPANK